LLASFSGGPGGDQLLSRLAHTLLYAEAHPFVPKKAKGLLPALFQGLCGGIIDNNRIIKYI
jgi:hypothetical protein